MDTLFNHYYYNMDSLSTNMVPLHIIIELLSYHYGLVIRSLQNSIIQYTTNMLSLWNIILHQGHIILHYGPNMKHYYLIMSLYQVTIVQVWKHYCIGILSLQSHYCTIIYHYGSSITQYGYVIKHYVTNMKSVQKYYITVYSYYFTEWSLYCISIKTLSCRSRTRTDVHWPDRYLGLE